MVDEKNPIKIGAPAVAPKPQPAPAPVTQTPKSVEADIDAMILGGVLERVVEPFPGWKVTMHTLTDAERIEAYKAVPNDIQLSMAASQEAVKLPTLVQAITHLDVNGITKHFATAEDKEGLKALLSRTSAIMLDVLYMEYLKLVNDLIVLVETGVKKN